MIPRRWKKARSERASGAPMRVLALHLQKQEGALLSITLPNFDAIQFVENSDRIVDIQEAKPKEDGIS